MPDSMIAKELGPATVPFTRRFRFRSRLADAAYLIEVALPAPYLPGSAPWPIVLVTDGNLAFPTAACTAGILPIEPGGPRPVCVVGIGYELSGKGERGEQFVLRNRDLTPARDENWEARMRAAPPPFGMGDDVKTGGGERFLDMIMEELLPWLGREFPVDLTDCTLVGNSFGANLALHAMFTRPGSFARLIAISPALWWANRDLERLEEEFAGGHDDLDAQLYLCVGEAEEAQAPETKMVSHCTAFAARLAGRNYPSLRMTHEVLPGETHISVFNAAISNGLRRLFGIAPV